MTLAKICGVTRLEDAQATATAGADFLGLNFWSGSRRQVHLADARDLAAAARTAGKEKVIRIVGVFVDASIDEIEAIAVTVPLDVVQLHGGETAATCREVFQRTGLPVWKARTLDETAGLAGWPVAAILLDAATPGRGGSGKTIDWAAAAAIARGATPVVLAGGLTPDNVADAVRTVRPWAVDVASGVETAPGVKDAGKIAAFVKQARDA
jgi:phosphoribosylanthranilate isomerase